MKAKQRNAAFGSIMLLGTWLGTVPAFAQAGVRANIDSLMKWSNRVGIFNGNVLVARDGKVIYSASLGSTDASRVQSLRSDDRFNIGSITKEFAAVAIMMLQEQGRLSLDDSVSKFIPELPAWSNQVRVRHLLDYTSGLPELRWNIVKNDKDVFDDLMKVDHLAFAPGTKFDYSNNNVSLRQFIVERITGMGFNAFAATKQLAQCGMTSSVMNPGPSVAHVARSFSDAHLDDPTDMPISGVAFVTTADMLKWAECLHSDRLISARSVYELGHSFRTSNGGLGNTAFRDSVLVRHTHDGQSRNFEAWLDDDLSNGTVVILLSNNKHFKLQDISSSIKSILKGEPFALPHKSVAQLLASDVDSLPIAALIARYEELRRTRSADLDVDTEDGLNSLGYQLMSKGRIDDAIRLFQMNVDRFPLSPNVHDSLGEAFLAKKDLRSALASYKKVLALEPNNAAVKQTVEKIRAALPP